MEEGSGPIYDVRSYEKPRSGKWPFILFGVVILVIVVIILIFAFKGFSKNISEDELSEGTTVELGEDKDVKFKVGDDEHHILIDFVGLDFVDITIQSEPIKVTLKINEVKKFDLDNDGIYDLRIKLVNIKDGKAFLYIRETDEVICEEDWSCTLWSDCSNGIQTRICNDLNNCGTNENKPEMERECLEIVIVDEEDNETEEVNQSENNETFDETNDFQLAITTSKEVYEIGELVEGDYNLNYTGESFQGLLLYIFSREGCGDSYASVRGTIDIYTIAGFLFEAFKSIKRLGDFCEYYSGTDYFFEEGNYTYTLAVYSCEEINDFFGIDDCDVGGFVEEASYENVVVNINPLESISKSVIVQGGEFIPECESNSYCTESCEFCEDETQYCEPTYQVCQDCFLNSNCIEGYTCENYTCVLE